MVEESEIVAKLEQLIRISAIQLTKDLESSKEKILLLGRTGMGPKEIAEILQTTPNHVNVTLSKARKSEKPKPQED
jgi:hypothetical protein